MKIKAKEIEIQFLNSFNLTESVKSEFPFRNPSYTSQRKIYSLKSFYRKLSNQIESGIPTRRALQIFAQDTNNTVIRRSISIIVEAEQSGEIFDILIAVVDSVINVKRIKKSENKCLFTNCAGIYCLLCLYCYHAYHASGYSQTSGIIIHARWVRW